jgi:D-alanyl-D-alanine carboxypeptidase (penicillin-binding protein 5/6)
MRERWRGGVLLCAAVPALAAGLLASPPAAAATPGQAATPPRTAAARPPACATAVAYSSGTATSTAVPLPAPASNAGGGRLAQPGLQVRLRPGTAGPPRLKASAWIVVDLGTGDVVAACNAHVPLAPASTLKVLTALALHSRIPATTRYTARPEDAAIDGTKVGLAPGSVYSVADLWHGLLMGSGNDTANALAALAGGTPAAAGLMNRAARSLGAHDTVAVNTSGLDAPGQVSSVYDLALFGRAALADPAIARLVRTTTYAFPAKGTALARGARRTYQIQNHNRLLQNYRGTTGIKNGYTSTAGASLVASATRGGRSYLVAMLRSDVNVWRMGASLFDWAFAQGGGAEPVGRLDSTPAPAAAPAVAPTTSPATPPTPSANDSASSSPVGRSVAPGAGNGAGSGSAGVPSLVTAPVRTTLATVPQDYRTLWLLALLALALTGGAMVRRLASAHAPAPRTAPARRPAAKRPAAKRPASSARPATGQRPAPRRSTSTPRKRSR